MKKQFSEKNIEQTFLLSEYGKQKLIGYAESFKEIAKALYNEQPKEEESESRQNHFYQRKLWENKCVLAENLNEMAGLMAQVAGEVFSYRPFTDRKSRQITQAMRNEGIFVRDLYYIDHREGHNKISVTMSTEHMGGVSVEEAADMLSVLLNIRLVSSISNPKRIDSSIRNYLFVEEAKYVILTGAARAVKETEPKSGDNYAILESERGKITLLLSDGMGSGKKACEDSETVLDLMEKLMDAGYAPRTAAGLINSTLVVRGDEQNMSTLDICELDLYDGMCEFTKIGAAASFIKRDHMVEQISANNLPLGIFRGQAEESICRRLMDGDYVFLLSDGIIDAVEECDYGEDICEILGNLKQENPKDLAEALLQIVLRKTRGRIRDDMTVVVFGIWENT